MTKIQSIHGDYDVSIYDTPEFVADLAKMPDHVCIIAPTVWKIYSDTILKPLAGSKRILLDVTEASKTLFSAQYLYDRLLEAKAQRGTTLVCIGGGVTQDVTAFVASTLFRGLDWVHVPTTLLAMADSCIGGKTCLNYHGYKNIIGTFWPPRKVFVFPPFCQTLPDNDYYSGLGEIVKIFVMEGQSWEMQLFLPGLVYRDVKSLKTVLSYAISMKAEYVSEDEFDKGRRLMLNYGHDFGHAVEAASAFRIPHGQAVVIGMILANKVARARGLLAAETEEMLVRDLLLPSLVVRPTAEELEPARILDAMRKDKKRTASGLALVMLLDGYEMVKVNDLTEQEVIDALGGWNE